MPKNAVNRWYNCIEYVVIWFWCTLEYCLRQKQDFDPPIIRTQSIGLLILATMTLD